MRLAAVVAALFSTLLVNVKGATIQVTVGANGQLAYTPPTVVATIGDIVSYSFEEGNNYTVTQSSFAAPCTPLTLAAANGTVPFSSGIKTKGQTYHVNVTVTSPIWLFSASPFGACEKGFVGAINAPTTGNHTYAAFKAAALRVNATTATLEPTSTYSSTGTGASVSPTTSHSGAMERFAGSGVAALVGIVGALVSAAM